MFLMFDWIPRPFFQTINFDHCVPFHWTLCMSHVDGFRILATLLISEHVVSYLQPILYGWNVLTVKVCRANTPAGLLSNSPGLMGIWTWSIVRYSKYLGNTKFRKLDFQVKEGYGYYAGPLRKRANLNHWTGWLFLGTQQTLCLPPLA
jgi:hypothetical protein